MTWQPSDKAVEAAEDAQARFLLGVPAHLWDDETHTSAMRAALTAAHEAELQETFREMVAEVEAVGAFSRDNCKPVDDMKGSAAYIRRRKNMSE